MEISFIITELSYEIYSHFSKRISDILKYGRMIKGHLQCKLFCEFFLGIISKKKDNFKEGDTVNI